MYEALQKVPQTVMNKLWVEYEVTADDNLDVYCILIVGMNFSIHY